jgi:hypothetical protein
MGTINSILAKVQGLLNGEPLRLVAYGADGVVIIVSQIAVVTGIWQNAPSLDVILVAVTGATALVTEFVRSIVSSPNTVAALGGPPAP